MAYALLLFFAPWNQNFDHDLPEFHSLASMAVCRSIFAARRIDTRSPSSSCDVIPLVSFGIGWFFLQLLPISLIPRNDLLSERNLYLASIGLVLAIIVLGSLLIQRLATVLPRSAISGSAQWASQPWWSCCSASSRISEICSTGTSFRSGPTRYSSLRTKRGRTTTSAMPTPSGTTGTGPSKNFALPSGSIRTIVLAQKNLRDAYLHQVGRQ